MANRKLSQLKENHSLDLSHRAIEASVCQELSCLSLSWRTGVVNMKGKAYIRVASTCLYAPCMENGWVVETLEHAGIVPIVGAEELDEWIDSVFNEFILSMEMHHIDDALEQVWVQMREDILSVYRQLLQK